MLLKTRLCFAKQFYFKKLLRSIFYSHKGTKTQRKNALHFFYLVVPQKLL